MIDVDVMQDASEIVHYDQPQIPLYIRQGLLSYYPDMRALCHWHEDIELIHILDGVMNYDVNGHKIFLQQGDTIVVNSRQMHYGYSCHRKECSFSCILFHPSLLLINEVTSRQYVRPIIDNVSIEYLVYSDPSEIGDLQRRILQLKQEKMEGYEFEVASLLFHLWTILYQTCRAQDQIPCEPQPSTDLSLQKKMVSFIYQNYGEPISLEDIASAGNVSSSKCCILFKKYLQQSPIDFVNSYRLEVSCNLLKHTTETISSIALACGFNHLSYYSKIFYRKYNCSPSTFRKKSPSP